MKQHTLTVETKGRGLYLITDQVATLVANAAIDIGLCHLFIHHTSASLIVCENADPQVLIDLEAFMTRLIPDGDSLYKHTMEGPDDMPAHVRSVLTQTDISIPITNSALALGRWQGIYLWEHRFAANQRQVTVTIIVG